MRERILDLYNELSCRDIEIDRSRPICERAKLDTGYLCNYDCTFCYYKDKLDQITNIDEIKRRADYLKECNIKEVDLSGGRPKKRKYKHKKRRKQKTKRRRKRKTKRKRRGKKRKTRIKRKARIKKKTRRRR